jgi:hypothetical protein
VHINSIWDRVEKVLFFLIDGALNWYFVRVVKKNLVHNGLHKYNRLVRYNQKMIVVSLLMDVMIIGAMSIPNGFVYVPRNLLLLHHTDGHFSYAIFHPLAYLLKLNIEMAMANLIKKIAIENLQVTDNISALYEFATTSFPEQSEKPLVKDRISRLGLSFTMPRSSKSRRTGEISVEAGSRSDWDFLNTHQRSQISTRDFSDGRSIQSGDLDLVLPSVRDSKSEASVERSTLPHQNDDVILKAPEQALKL